MDDMNNNSNMGYVPNFDDLNKGGKKKFGILSGVFAVITILLFVLFLFLTTKSSDTVDVRKADSRKQGVNYTFNILAGSFGSMEINNEMYDFYLALNYNNKETAVVAIPASKMFSYLGQKQYLEEGADKLPDYIQITGAAYKITDEIKSAAIEMGNPIFGEGNLNASNFDENIGTYFLAEDISPAVQGYGLICLFFGLVAFVLTIIFLVISRNYVKSTQRM